MSHEQILELREGFESAFINGMHAANISYKPQFLSNNYKEGKIDVDIGLRTILCNYCS